jgi:predicted metal-dependent peptidase
MSYVKSAIGSDGKVDSKACKLILNKYVIPLFGTMTNHNNMMTFISELLNYAVIKYKATFHKQGAPATSNGKYIYVYNGFFVKEELTEEGLKLVETSYNQKLGLLVYQLFSLMYRYTNRLRIVGSDPDFKEIARLAVLLKNNTNVLAVSEQAEKESYRINNSGENLISLPKDSQGNILTITDVPGLDNRNNNSITLEGLFTHLAEMDKEELENLIEQAQDSPTYYSIEIDEDSPSTEAEEAVQRDQWNRFIDEAFSKIAGTEAGDSLKEYSDIHNPGIPYHKLLRSFMLDRLSKDARLSWNKPNRRSASYMSLGYDVVLPIRIPNESLNTACIYLDTSASMGVDETTEAISHISNIQKETGCNIHLIYSDVNIQGEHIISSDNSFYDYIVKNDLLPKGNGGTDFRPVQERMLELEKENDNYNVYIMITDLYGPYMDSGSMRPISNKLLWLVTQNSDNNRPDYGRLLVMNSKEFEV